MSKLSDDDIKFILKAMMDSYGCVVYGRKGADEKMATWRKAWKILNEDQSNGE